MKKKMSLQTNSRRGIDLMIEKDAGNPILITTGCLERSIEFWSELQMSGLRERQKSLAYEAQLTMEAEKAYGRKVE